MNETFNSQNLIQLGPYIVLLTAPVLMMISVAIRRNHIYTWVLTLVAFLLSFILAANNMDAEPGEIPLLEIDRFSLFYACLFGLTCFLIVLSSYSYLEK